MNNKGFTLIELTIVMVIIGIVAVIGGVILIQAFEAGNASRNLIDATWQSRLALQRMTDEIREAHNIISTTDNQHILSFTSINGTTITYNLSGNHLVRNNTTLADSVTALTFTYLNTNNQTLTYSPLDIDTVRCINISTTISKNHVTTSFQTLACPRNML